MPRRYFEEQKETSHPKVYKRIRTFREIGDEPQRGHCPRHDKYKSVRKGRCSGKEEPVYRETAYHYHGKIGAPPPKYMKRQPYFIIRKLYLI